ncbi:MAG: hypothetical protein AAF741_05925 [Bacteroidota bacterium]
MKSIFFGFTLFALCIMSCGKEDAPTPEEPVLAPERINFQSPEVGQFNEYELFMFTCGEPLFDVEGEVRWEVTAVTETEVEIRETSGDLDVTTFTADRMEAGWSITAEERVESNMLFFYGDDLIRVNAPTTAEVRQQDCVFFDGNEKFTGEYVARAAQYVVEDVELRDMKVVSCVPTILDLDGYLIYNRNTLYASFSANNFGEDPVIRTYVLKQ